MILRKRVEKKNEDVFREDQFGFSGGKELEVLRKMSEETLNMDEFCASFTNYHKAFECANWTKLRQILI